MNNKVIERRWISAAEAIERIRAAKGWTDSEAHEALDIWINDGKVKSRSLERGGLAGVIAEQFLRFRAREFFERKLWEIDSVTLEEVLSSPRKSLGDAMHPKRGRGAHPTQSPRVLAEMRAMPRQELEDMKEEAMRSTFGASRDTCRRNRNEVLAEPPGIVDN
jgi:hypothetical protein